MVFQFGVQVPFIMCSSLTHPKTGQGARVLILYFLYVAVVGIVNPNFVKYSNLRQNELLLKLCFGIFEMALKSSLWLPIPSG